MQRHFDKNNQYYKMFEQYVLEFWRPNCDISIKIIEEAIIYNWLCKWFEFLNDSELCNNTPDNVKHTIQSFINITPYAKFDCGLNKDKQQVWEFMFVDEGTDLSKLTKNQLMI